MALQQSPAASLYERQAGVWIKNTGGWTMLMQNKCQVTMGSDLIGLT